MVSQVKENLFVIASAAVLFGFLKGYGAAHWGGATPYIFAAILAVFSVLTDTSLRTYAPLARDVAIGIAVYYLVNLSKFLG